MARSAFKDLMNNIVTNNTYHFYEKGVFALAAGIMVFLVIIFHQPVNEIIVIEQPKSDLI